MMKLETVTVEQVKGKHPFPWSEEINYDGAGTTRVLDARGFEVGLLSVIALATLTSQGRANG